MSTLMSELKKKMMGSERQADFGDDPDLTAMLFAMQKVAASPGGSGPVRVPQVAPASDGSDVDLSQILSDMQNLKAPDVSSYQSLTQTPEEKNQSEYVGPSTQSNVISISSAARARAAGGSSSNSAPSGGIPALSPMVWMSVGVAALLILLAQQKKAR